MGFDVSERVHHKLTVWMLAVAGFLSLYVLLHLLGWWASAIAMVISDSVILYNIWDRRTRRSWLLTAFLVFTIGSMLLERLTGKDAYLEVTVAACAISAGLILIERNRVI